MTIYTDWKVLARQPIAGGTPAGMSSTSGVPDRGFDLTPRLRGLVMVDEVEYGEVGSRQIELALDNSDGGLSFLPYDSGFLYDEDRTYDNGVNWFNNWIIYIVPCADTTDGTTEFSAFGGLIVTDVEVEDDGFTSIVTVFARDFATWMERSALANVNIVAVDVSTAIQQLIESHVTPLGADVMQASVFAPAGVTVTVGDITLQFPDGVSPLEVLKQIMTIDFGLLFPINLSYLVVGSTTYCEASVVVATPLNLMPKSTVAVDALRFTDPTSIAAGRAVKGVGTVYDLLPYRNLTFDFDLRRNATVAYLASSTESALSSDAARLDTYGARTINMTELPVATAPGGTSQQYLTDQADMLTAWWQQSESNVEGLEISGGMIESYCEDGALEAVVQVMYNGATYYNTLIDIPGAGGTLVQGQGTFLRSTLYVTPTDWVIRLEKGLGSQVGFGYRLDDEDLGVLDENRLAAPTKIY